MEQNTANTYRDVCARIRSVLPAACAWQWDDRFGVGVVSFDAAVRDAVLAALHASLPGHWDAATIKSAPQHVAKVVKDVFDIKKGQLVFAAFSDGAPALIAAWWPWGDGTTTSLRVGMFPGASGQFGGDEAQKLLTEWLPIS